MKTLRKAHGSDAPFVKYFTQDVTQGFFLDANYEYAVNYAKQGPERIRSMLEHIRDLEREYQQGKFSERVSLSNVNKLMQILQRLRKSKLLFPPPPAPA